MRTTTRVALPIPSKTLFGRTGPTRSKLLPCSSYLTRVHTSLSFESEAMTRKPTSLDSLRATKEQGRWKQYPFLFPVGRRMPSFLFTPRNTIASRRDAEAHAAILRRRHDVFQPVSVVITRLGLPRTTSPSNGGSERTSNDETQHRSFDGRLSSRKKGLDGFRERLRWKCRRSIRAVVDLFRVLLRLVRNVFTSTKGYERFRLGFASTRERSRNEQSCREQEISCPCAFSNVGVSAKTCTVFSPSHLSKPFDARPWINRACLFFGI